MVEDTVKCFTFFFSSLSNDLILRRMFYGKYCREIGEKDKTAVFAIIMLYHYCLLEGKPALAID